MTLQSNSHPSQFAKRISIVGMHHVAVVIRPVRSSDRPPTESPLLSSIRAASRFGLQIAQPVLAIASRHQEWDGHMGVWRHASDLWRQVTRENHG